MRSQVDAKFPKIGTCLVHHMSQVDHKSSAKVLHQQKHFNAKVNVFKQKKDNKALLTV